MFQLDDKFLQDVGLGDLPEDQKQAFLQHIYSELELRVGTKLFDRYLANYRELPDFQSLRASAPADVSDLVVLSEYGSLKWLEMNRPDYKQVVANEVATLKAEITQNRDSILGSNG